MKSTINDCIFWNDFVQPKICYQLKKLGLICGTAYQWKCYGENMMVLDCREFDVDNYYLDTVKEIDEVGRPEIYNAFSIAQMNLLLPDYTMVRNKDGFMISLINYNIPSTAHKRLPDALAYMVIDLLHHHYLKLDAANDIIAYKSIHT